MHFSSPEHLSFLLASFSLPSSNYIRPKHQTTMNAQRSIEDTRAWRAPALSNFPFLATLCLAGALMGMTSAFAVLYYANDSRVDKWPIAPTVFLSIIAALTNRMISAAFRYASDIHWWSRLIEGVTIQELHTLWDLAYNLLSLLTSFPEKRIHPVVRFGAIFLSLTAVNGPLLQRAITVEVENRMSVRSETLPIRQQPMWNLTTKVTGNNGHVWTVPPYQDEIAEIALELSQRQPMRLQSSVCSANSTCSTNVVIAAFNRMCEESTARVANLSSMDVAKYVRVRNEMRDDIHYCPYTGGARLNSDKIMVLGKEMSSYCNSFETVFQLSVHDLNPSFTKDNATAPPWDLPWKGPGMAPSIIQYTSYIRQEARSEEILTRNCNFSTAFVQLPIEITNGSVVTLLSSKVARLDDIRGEESIPHAIRGLTSQQNNIFLGGIIQILKDQYDGYIMDDTNEYSHVMQGSSPRQYVNQSSIEARNPGYDGPEKSYLFSMLDPLEDFTRTINEISLRYALKSLPDDVSRTQELTDYVQFQTKSDLREDNRPNAIPLMETKFSKTAVVELQENQTVAVYRSQYVFTAVAMGLIAISSAFIMMLLHGWRHLGRQTSLAPLEIAKAFDAPLLSDVPSNSTGNEVAAGRLRNLTVKYGEVYPSSKTQTERGSLLESQETFILPGPDGESHMNLLESSSAIELTEQRGDMHRRIQGPKLAVEVADLVANPQSGTKYH
ncbi:unnamed protein product [Clonostachys byssicola]|uniref:Uncharacterized protein n=1 Tax=Clonostachys byssicola TaxID=160290 RepID=A0A9N9U2S2_9HYPO|nr:unnamed protein product [Clonostachys byssicola]